MYILIETQEDFAQLNSTAKKCIASLCECISPDRTQAKIPAGTNVFQNAEAKQKLYVLRDGVLEYRRGERMLLYFDEGDLVGLEQHFQAGTVEVCSDFAVTVDEYDVNRLFTQIASDPSPVSYTHLTLPTMDSV